MKDFIGKSVDVGDCIFYSTTGRYAETRLGVVTRFTAKSIFMRVLKGNRPSTRYEEVVVRNSFIKVDVTNTRFEKMLDESFTAT